MDNQQKEDSERIDLLQEHLCMLNNHIEEKDKRINELSITVCKLEGKIEAYVEVLNARRI